MILQRLVEYYDRLANDPKSSSSLARPGYSQQKISFCVVLEPDGRLQQFQSLLEASQKKLVPRQLLVPGQSKPSGSGINPCFLWDNAAYLLGFKQDDPNPQRSRESFEAFRNRHLAFEQQIDAPAFSAVCKFLRNWSPETAVEHAASLKDISASFGVLRIAGSHFFVHDDPAIVSFWAGHDAADPAASRGMCLITGQHEPIARLHEPKIKGVRGAQAAGALLVSFNDEAYTSFRKEQSFNAPVSIGAMFKYTNALNYLLGRADRRLSLGDATVVFWAEHSTPLESFASEILADLPTPADDAPVENKRRAEQVRLFLSQLRAGHAGAEAIDPEDATRFYILGLSPNASRLSVRFWADNTVGKMKARLATHMESLEIVGAHDPGKILSVRQIVNATARVYNDKLDYGSISPRLSGDVTRAILSGTPFPNELLAAILSRVSADGQINHTRASIIKSFLIREGKVAMDVYLNKEHTEPAYHCGRLLAVLAFAQEQALGTINAGVIRRNLGSVMSTPGLRLGRLQAAAEVGHIPKLKRDLPTFVRDELKSINVAIRDTMPVSLDLRGQGVFMLGFYQQLQYLDFVGARVFEGKLVRTIQGEWVRSKGEASVAELLTKLGRRYIYEPHAILEAGTRVWPDFVIRGNTAPSEDIYIEYLGMNTEEYNERWSDKLIGYRKFGITQEGGERGRLVVLDERTSELGDNDMLNSLRAVLGPVGEQS